MKPFNLEHHEFFRVAAKSAERLRVLQLSANGSNGENYFPAYQEMCFILLES
jgi:hypothetical protein